MPTFTRAEAIKNLSLSEQEFDSLVGDSKEPYGGEHLIALMERRSETLQSIELSGKAYDVARYLELAGSAVYGDTFGRGCKVFKEQLTTNCNVWIFNVFYLDERKDLDWDVLVDFDSTDQTVSHASYWGEHGHTYYVCENKWLTSDWLPSHPPENSSMVKVIESVCGKLQQYVTEINGRIREATDREIEQTQSDWDKWGRGE